MKPLAGIRVVEMTHVISAPFCGQLLGDMGADIIKIEKHDGEFSRDVPPKQEDGPSIWFPNYNRNKRGMKMNFRDPRAIEIIRKLIAKADVFIENMRPGLVKQLGLGYKDLKKINPKLIMCSISGYGQTGPLASNPAFDMTIEAMCGIMSLTGEPDGKPMKVGTAITDFASGYCGAIGILAALLARGKTGEGQYIDVAMLEASLPLLETAFAEYKVLNSMPPRVGNSRATGGPCNVFKTKDEIFILLSVTGLNIYHRFCRVIGREDLITDPRFAESSERKKHQAEIEAIVADWIIQYTYDELMAISRRHGIPIARVNTVKEIFEEPQIKARGAIVIGEDAELGLYPYIRFPLLFSDLETGIFRNPPTLGQHNEEILCGELGYSKEEYEQLVCEEVV